MTADHDLAGLVRRCDYAPSSSSPTRMAPSVDRPLDQKPSKEAVLGRRQFHVTSREGDVTAYPDIESWVKRSQNPKTGLARTSRTAYATISASTLMLRDPSAIPQILGKLVVSQVQRRRANLHWVDGPKNQGKSGNGAEESSGFLVLVLNDTTAVERKLVHND